MFLCLLSSSRAVAVKCMCLSIYTYTVHSSVFMNHDTYVHVRYALFIESFHLLREKQCIALHDATTLMKADKCIVIQLLEILHRANLKYESEGIRHQSHSIRITIMP